VVAAIFLATLTVGLVNVILKRRPCKEIWSGPVPSSQLTSDSGLFDTARGESRRDTISSLT